MRGHCPLIFSILSANITNYITLKVGLLGVEPRLFWTKTRRVANYTIGQLGVKFKIKFEVGQIKFSNSLFT